MQTAASDYFTGIRDSLTGLAVDWGRSKLIDVETRQDDRNIPDYVDVKTGQASATGGMSVGAMVAIGVLALVGIVVLKKVL